MNQQDEHAGQGGSYVVGKDGKRQLVERTAEPKQTQEAVPEPAAPADDKPASKKR